MASSKSILPTTVVESRTLSTGTLHQCSTPLPAPSDNFAVLLGELAMSSVSAWVNPYDEAPKSGEMVTAVATLSSESTSGAEAVQSVGALGAVGQEALLRRPSGKDANVLKRRSQAPRKVRTL